MNTRRLVAAALLCLGLGASQAQLSSPMPGVEPMPSGPGVHSPDSPIAPLKERADVLPWGLLTDVKVKIVKNRVMPIFPAVIQALDQKTQRVQGFMMPLEAGERHTHFLLTSVPMSCSFCVPGGPESMVEVRTRKPVKYTLEPVVVQGRFAVLQDDPYGLYYRITNAVVVK
ncbi:MAG: DUF3299 domain-containing protein [Hylemonella sp.]|nr:DUF3299 domain-containing protein [Hylemonella sp.]MDH5708659.1 DUF3299 domain-containing protein [Hylemonella sp.]